MEKENVEERINLLLDFHVQKNLNHTSMLVSKDELRNMSLERIKSGQNILRFYVVKSPNKQVIGYCWISSIDWIEQSCELSISIFPEFRVGYGLLALLEMYEYLYQHLNMKTIVNQSLEGNSLLLAKNSSIKENAIRSDFDSYTFGRYRSSYLWTQTIDEYKKIGKLRSEKLAKLKSKLKSKMKV
nr:GNAT family N-acetyltransferase [Sporosarcina sp. 6E9]